MSSPVLTGVLFFTDTIQIRFDGGATDLDMIGIDPPTGTAGLFQLKWQDPFGTSMRERESKKSNFLKTSNAWIRKVSHWIEEGKLQQALISAGLPQRLAAPKRVLLFVLGRNFSHFSGEREQDGRAAWGNWGQVVRLLETKDFTASPLERLFDELRADAPLQRVAIDRDRDEIVIPGLRVVVHQPAR